MLASLISCSGAFSLCMSATAASYPATWQTARASSSAASTRAHAAPRQPTQHKPTSKGRLRSASRRAAAHRVVVAEPVVHGQVEVQRARACASHTTPHMRQTAPSPHTHVCHPSALLPPVHQMRARHRSASRCQAARSPHAPGVLNARARRDYDTTSRNPAATDRQHTPGDPGERRSELWTFEPSGPYGLTSRGL